VRTTTTMIGKTAVIRFRTSTASYKLYSYKRAMTK
jgi:hypothetical protein